MRSLLLVWNSIVATSQDSVCASSTSTVDNTTNCYGYNFSFLHLYRSVVSCDTGSAKFALIAKENAMNIRPQTHKLELLLKKHQLLTLNEVQPKMAIECKEGV